MESKSPLVGVIMGSVSDWETMRHAVEMLERFGIPCEKRVVSADPDFLDVSGNRQLGDASVACGVVGTSRFRRGYSDG